MENTQSATEETQGMFDLRHLKENAQLAQAAALTLRGVMPYAREEVASLHAATHRDLDESVAEAAKEGDVAIERAEKLLRAFDKSHLALGKLKDDHFDNHIDTYLNENSSED